MEKITKYEELLLELQQVHHLGKMLHDLLEISQIV